MAGGNVAVATALFFDTQFAGVEAGSQAVLEDDWEIPDWHTFIWPDKRPLPLSWLAHGFVFSTTPGIRFGLQQSNNGPCGVLAAVQGLLAAEVPGPLTPDLVVADVWLAGVLARALDRARHTAMDPIQIARWTGAVGQAVTFDVISPEGLLSFIEANLARFTAPGGLVLFVYSMAKTRTFAGVQEDTAESQGQLPLIDGPNYFCSSELVSLVLRGRANGCVGAFDALGRPHTWSPAPGVGLLSLSENSSGIPVCDTLKNPLRPVWILHGTDHFTTVFAAEGMTEIQAPGSFTLYHWNGLPPAGPRMVQCQVTHQGVCPPAPLQHVETFFKPMAGEIEEVVQADPADKQRVPDDWRSWRYEVQLARDDPDVVGAERPAGMPPEPVFAQGPVSAGPWRCAACFATRFQTMCFGLNADGATVCEHCQQPRLVCGWTLWRPYAELPVSIQCGIDRRYGPKFQVLLRTKWPSATITYTDIPSNVVTKQPPSV